MIDVNTFITTYLPSDARAFNTTQTAMHILRERIHFPWKAHHGTSLGPHALGAWPRLNRKADFTDRILIRPVLK
jgi:hypothetical protein